MTNAEKYLKDGVSVDEFLTKVIEHCSRSSKNSIETFLNDNSKPTLTEDERVILRNLHEEYKHIRRNEMGNLYVGVDYFGMYDSLFQFIKERRRIFNRGTFERRIRMDWQGLREDFKQKHKERVAKTPQRIEYAKQEFKKQSINAELKNEQTGQFNIKAGTHIITYYCSTGKILVDNKPYEQRGIRYAIYKAKKLERRRI